MWAVSFPHLVALSVVVSAVVVVVVAERIVCIIISIVRVNPSTGKVPGILLPLRANHCPTTRWMHSYPEASTTAITIIITIIRTMKIAALLVVLAVRGVWRLDVALRT